MGSHRVLLLYYSYSSQAKNLLQGLAEGLIATGIEVAWERIEPVDPPRFPLGSIPATLAMMISTFVRIRLPINPPSPICSESWDLIVLGGPTWSYNPSGPVLELLDRYGTAIFPGKSVIPLITCRGYWRTHWWYLRRRLCKMGARVENRIVFSHLNPEPWRTIGVFLKLAGRVPERGTWISRYYTKYGHTRAQVAQAVALGRRIGAALNEGLPMVDLDLRSDLQKPPDSR